MPFPGRHSLFTTLFYALTHHRHIRSSTVGHHNISSISSHIYQSSHCISSVPYLPHRRLLAGCVNHIDINSMDCIYPFSLHLPPPPPHLSNFFLFLVRASPCSGPNFPVDAAQSIHNMFGYPIFIVTSGSPSTNRLIVWIAMVSEVRETSKVFFCGNRLDRRGPAF